METLKFYGHRKASDLAGTKTKDTLHMLAMYCLDFC